MWASQPAVGTPLDWAHPLNRGLAGYWPLWEGVGGKVYDLSGAGSVGTLTNITQGPTSGWTGGFAGGHSLRFDGSDDFVSLGDKASYDFLTSDFTLCARVNPSSSNTRDAILGKDDAGANRDWFWGLNTNSIGTNVAGQVAFGWSSDTVKFYNGDSAAGIVPVDKWSDLAVGRRGAKLFLHVNGAAVTFTESASGGGAVTDTVRDTSVSLEIGRRTLGGGFNDNFHGRIADVRIYNARALTPTEIWQLHAQPYSMFARPLASRVFVRRFNPAWAVGANQILGGGIGA